MPDDNQALSAEQQRIRSERLGYAAASAQSNKGTANHHQRP
jgi:hypothetical protein